MDEVIGVTNGYGCGNRRKSGTVGYLLNQSSDKPSTTGEALLRRQLRFLVASFWRLASPVGGLLGKQATFSIGKIPINNRPEWWGRRPSLLQWKGGNRRFTAAPLQLPFAQGTSSENNVGNRVRTFRCYAL